LLPSMHWNWLLTVTFSSMLRNLTIKAVQAQGDKKPFEGILYAESRVFWVELIEPAFLMMIYNPTNS